jgi:UDP-N-acetylmuramoyl-tripeptide--D-alanyl-D-alanine ligase
VPGASEIQLAAGWIAAVVGGAVVGGDAGQRFTGVSIDTRTLGAGELFVGIRGERFDGADFAGAAIAALAGGVLVPRGRRPVGRASVAVIEVGDTTAALQALAHAVRVESGTKVVAITGSAGKTTTKELTAELLASRYRVIRNRGNFNNHIGLPLSLIDLRQRPDIAVVELGMNHTGEISTLVGISEPDVRVWTNVGEAHLGFFASLDATADAKAEIFEGATPATVLVANADDERVVARLPRFAGRVVTFGIEHDADVRATKVVDRGVEGMTARVSARRHEADLTTPLLGRGNLENLLAAAGVALEFDMPLAAIADRLPALAPASRRGEVVRLARGVTIIDDSYNANPTATRRALDVLAASPQAARRIAVLGEMLELGTHAGRLHEEVGRAAAAAHVDRLIAVGGAPAAALAAAAVAAGMPRAGVSHCATSEGAADEVASIVRPGDLVLVKGSRGIRTDRVVDRLKAECA